MQIYNQKYLNIAEDILRYGRQKEGRNGYTRSLPFKELEFDMRNHYFPLLTSRKIHYEGVLGEYAAIIRQPKNVKDFQKWGCNYWNEFGDPDTGKLRLSYGNSWYNFNGGLFIITRSNDRKPGCIHNANIFCYFDFNYS